VSLYTELVEYTGKPETLVRKRCQYAPWELAWLWHDIGGRIYTESDLYIYDLTKYQQYLRIEYGVRRVLRAVIEKYDWRAILDYGGGIGEWSIIAAQQGCDVVYYDLDGPTRDYALWRFNRHGVEIATPLDEAEALSREYDCVIAMDVLEHLCDPQPLLDWLRTHTRYLLANPREVEFGREIWPQHISEYTLEPEWRHIDWYLWERADDAVESV